MKKLLFVCFLAMQSTISVGIQINPMDPFTVAGAMGGGCVGSKGADRYLRQSMIQAYANINSPFVKAIKRSHGDGVQVSVLKVKEFIRVFARHHPMRAAPGLVIPVFGIYLGACVGQKFQNFINN